MSQRPFTRSFAAGELSPQLFGRLDLAKFQTGLAKCLNFIVTPQGPVHNRPGFEYVLKTKFSTRTALIPFSYNSEQTFALEFGVGYIRFHTLGGTLLEAGKALTGITVSSTGVFTSAGHGYANGNWVFLSGIGGMTGLNGRWGVVANATANTFTLIDMFGSAIRTTGMPAYTGGGAAYRVYEIATPYVEQDLFDLHYVQSADVMTICHQNYASAELRRLGATNWTLVAIPFGTTVATPGTPTATADGPGGGTPETYSYCYTAVKSGTLEESLASGSASASQDLSVAGNSISTDTTQMPEDIGAVRFNVYKYKGVFGYIGSVSEGHTSFRDDNTEPDTSKTPPQFDDPFATNSPRAVSYFEQRRCFGGSTANPQTLWLTRSGTESNMNYSIPTQDDDPITARIVAREANTIRHLVPLGDLLALTSGGVWRVAPSGGGALTPANFSAKPQSYVGASNVQPMVTNQSVLYAPDRGSHVREVTYKSDGSFSYYNVEDVCVLAPHLFDYKNISQLAYTRSPLQVLWAVRTDGVLLGFTHVPEHDVKAWHQHDTQGLFKSVCAVAEGDQDGLYAIIERQINGQTVQYIERMHSRDIVAESDAFFVDSGLTYRGAAASTITGLWHLEGMEVSILADAGVVAPKTVTNGQIELDSAASVVHVGLAYNSDFQTMPVSLETPAFGQGTLKNVNKMQLRVHASSGVRAGPSFDATKLRAYSQRTAQDPYDSAPGQVTGIVEMSLSPSWQENGQVCVRQSDPLPLTILAMTTEVASGG